MALDLVKATGAGAFEGDAPFVSVDGANTRHDDRNGISAFATVTLEGFYAGTEEANKRLSLHPDTPRFYLGAMARAHLGVLFIDEIGEPSAGTQNVPPTGT